MERRRIRPAIVGRDPGMDFLGAGLGVDDFHVPVAALVEGAGVDEIVRWGEPVPARVLGDQGFVGKSGLRILVEVAQIAVARGGIQVEVDLLDVFAAIALVAGQTECPFLEDRILAVPQGEGEAQALLLVADAAEAVLAPAVGAGPRLVVGEEPPGVAVGAVVLADGAPGPFGEIGPPQAPVLGAGPLVFEALPLGVEESVLAHFEPPVARASRSATRSAQA